MVRKCGSGMLAIACVLVLTACTEKVRQEAAEETGSTIDGGVMNAGEPDSASVTPITEEEILVAPGCEGLAKDKRVVFTFSNGRVMGCSERK